MSLNTKSDFYDVLAEKRNVKVERARYADVPRIQQMAQDAYEDDPLRNYLRNTPDAKKPPVAPRRDRLYIWRLMAYLELGFHIHYHAAFPVEHGDAYVTIGHPSPGRTKSAVLRMLSRVTNGVLNRTNTPEQRKRWEEFEDKIAAASKDAFGDELRRMLHVLNLAVAPRHQGKGYGYALMALANAQADEIRCASWLLSSNVINTPFYESCGFVVVKEVLLGEDNPTWTERPFAILIMMRAARS
ncbi:uncharacterized protein B0H18DRAFT_246859 [Fomitopsis serialis]|uniref:uncharacterized protein n=1 Tax=Fomitopsis serialis TaxID=139415 RepID=UPI00200883D0|nr:uncharacterized protein B0H18DRAFT_246859 [Neoantrodia serialis]KAH9928719.1 hypothetical protein B0H18DRAFT_246859 [Neoantrodia serialis]